MATPNGDFDGNDFANNLFTDLAPLLTLFGDIGWADSVLLAMGPLGILNIIVSAIRIAGDQVPISDALIGKLYT
ncbi:hypothetical protein QC761_607440 [Podospora bellae-mahoneyi]|uniref:Uncharacterized protein n=1 Tax=Podospora bellae-mahoneyi TaxID=2093777 RepID=A0ABR0FCJ7_9PEZI|nr:hypothetical protein QC761_607440 [Podospora bellae-mahoneyi]